jgi:hypothetical protein
MERGTEEANKGRGCSKKIRPVRVQTEWQGIVMYVVGVAVPLIYGCAWL